MERDQEGRVAVVTGGTSGVGRAFATALADRGAHVVLLARDEARGAQACAAIRRVAPTASLEVVTGDLSDLTAARAAVATVAAAHPRIDILGTMAGVYDPSGRRSPEGFEIHLATNVLSAWVVACTLRENLLAAAPARAILLSGNLHLRARFDLDDLALERAGPMAAAKRTMLYKVAIAAALARRCPSSRVSFNAVCPGFTRSGLMRNLPWHLRALGAVASLFAHSPAKGSETAVALATQSRFADVSARYFRLGRERTPNPEALDRGKQDALLEWLAEVTGCDWSAE